MTDQPRQPLPQKKLPFPALPEWGGLRLKQIVQLCVPGLSSRNAMLIIKNGLVRTSEGMILDDADLVLPEVLGLEIDLRHGVHGQGEAQRPRLHERMNVLLDDDQVVVVVKAPFTPVQPVEEEGGQRGQSRPPLIELLKHYWREKGKGLINPIVVQRLDMETSGLLVLAKTEEAGHALQKQLLAPRRLERRYLALCRGVFTEVRGTWSTTLGRGPVGLRQSIPPKSRGGQSATTHFHAIEKLKGATLVELKLETGRTHQIRIHCAESCHPLLGDDVYVKIADHYFEKLSEKPLANPKRNDPRWEAQEFIAKMAAGAKPPKPPDAGRILLHAYKLAFDHPGTGKRMSFEEPLPKDYADYLEALRKATAESKVAG